MHFHLGRLSLPKPMIKNAYARERSIPVIISPVTKNTTQNSSSHLLATSNDDSLSFLFIVAFV